MSGEFEDEYSATIDESLTKTDDLRDSSDALLNDTIAVLAPAQPLCLGETATVHDAVDKAGSPEFSPSATCSRASLAAISMPGERRSAR